MTRHISTLDLHRYRYGELADEATDRVRTHLDACERCARRLGVQQTEREAFVLEAVPPAILEPALGARPANQPAGFRWLIAGLAVAAAAAVALTQLPTADPTAPTIENTRPKGQLPLMEVWIESASGPRIVRPGESLEAGDIVQPMVRGDGSAFVTLAGRDGTGAVELWGVVQPEATGLTPADFALTLDDAPGPQTFYAIGASRPLTLDEVHEVLAGKLRADWLTEEVLDKE